MTSEYLSYFLNNLSAIEKHVGALLYVLVIGIACAGYGRTLDHCFPSGRRANFGVAMALGLAAMILVGALLNLFHAFSLLATIALLGGGVLLSIRGAGEIRRVPGEFVLAAHTHPALTALLTITISVTVFGHFFAPDFFQFDDLPAYLVFPEKMAQMGHLGPDFFSERRLEASLGATYFLQALISVALGRYYLHLIDPVLGYFILWFIVYGTLKEHHVELRWRLVSLLVLGLFTPNVVNLSVTILPAGMILAMACVVQDPSLFSKFTVGRSFQFALLAAAAAATKSNVIPTVAIFSILVYGSALVMSRSLASLVEALVSAALMLLSLAPWMVAQLQDTGTLLFPLLGAGGFGGQYGNFDFAQAHPMREQVITYLHDGVATPAVLCVAALTVLALVARRGIEKQNYLLFLALPTLLLANLALCLATGGEGLIRYAYPAEATCMAIAITFGLRALPPPFLTSPRGLTRLSVGALVLMTCFCVSLILHAYYIEKYMALAIRNAGMAILGPPLRPAMLYSNLERNDREIQRAMRQMQNAVPENATLFERLDFPFLLDFRRNPIVVVDWPGGASPPPGLPLFRGADALINYLRKQNIRYVAYAYQDEALFPESDRATILTSPWVRADAEAAWDFQRNLSKLIATQRILYDDGVRAVIDLQEPRRNPA